MPMKLGDGWTDRGRIGNWRLPGEPAFATSRAFGLLLRDLQRYVREEIAGRSFLIAGHRGAGKSATVTQALRQIRNDILYESQTSPSAGRRGRLQRPLMVKLVGESLIAPPPEIRRPEKETAKKEAEEAGKKDPAPDSAPEAKPAAEKPQDRVESALVHITIALYRALAAEVVEGYSVHALEGDERQRLDRMELAAQLALELDGTPEPATLRHYWERLGRLADGVLWPPDSDAALRPIRFPDQGFREIVAVATAAQAFQVCSGAITYTVTSQDSSSRDSKVESGLDVKDLVNRLGPLLAGALAGGAVGAQNGPVAGVGSGLIVLLASALTLRWTGSRERKSERKLDYTFLRDRSIQTLDRDLPLVIGRIREAGLAPVFVIDELDKLDHPSATIADIIKRLKHFVSDYGFFCFLTDRNYFDEIEQKVMVEAYPTEHTYFGERILILNRPQDLYHYVDGLIERDPTAESQQSLRRAVFALVVMFRSRLNFSDLSREIDRLILPDNTVIASDHDLLAPGRLRLEATIQLAINEVLSSDEVMERFRTDPGFAQLAIDALYYIPRSWQSNSDDEIDIGEEALGKALLDRRRACKRQAAADHGAEPGKPAADSAADSAAEPESPPISPPDLRELTRMVGQLADHLEDFKKFKKTFENRAANAPPDQRTLLADWASVVVDVRGKLIRRVSGGKGHVYCHFMLDELARDTPERPTARPAPTVPRPAPAPGRKTREPARPRNAVPGPAVAPPSPPAPAFSASAPPAEPAPSPPQPVTPALLEAISGLISTTQLSIGDLVANRLLPATVSDSSFDATLADIRLVQHDPDQTDAARRAVEGQLAFQQAFDIAGDHLARSLVLLAYTLLDTEERAAPGVVLGRIARYLAPGSRIEERGSRPFNMGWIRMRGTAESIETFDEEFRKWRNGLKGKPIVMTAKDYMELWRKWRGQVMDFIRRGKALLSARVEYLDLISAAMEETPGRLFRSSLIEMDQLDWSRAALAALPDDKGMIEGPYWLFFASLVALGFDRATLAALASGPAPPGLPAPSNETFSHIDDIIRYARSAPPGIFHVYPDGVGAALPREIPTLKPMLSVGESLGPNYMMSLNWLAESGLFDEGRDEI